VRDEGRDPRQRGVHPEVVEHVVHLGANVMIQEIVSSKKWG
jgi:hypothetical protein